MPLPYAGEHPAAAVVWSQYSSLTIILQQFVTRLYANQHKLQFLPVKREEVRPKDKPGAFFLSIFGLFFDQSQKILCPQKKKAGDLFLLSEKVPGDKKPQKKSRHTVGSFGGVRGI